MKNFNFPKCANCLQNNCQAGEVNHEARNSVNGERTNCLLCSCEKFVECKLSRQQLEEIIN